MARIDDDYALIVFNRRAISKIIPNVVLEENHQDNLGVTNHPVEQGAVVTDHSFKAPARVEMYCGWSNSTGAYEGYVQEVYEALLELQATREPFDLYTGKRAYKQMLLQGLAVHTDVTSENALMVRASLQEIIIAQTQSASPGASAPNSAQRDPATTGSVVERGGANIFPVDQSFGGYNFGNPTEPFAGATGITSRAPNAGDYAAYVGNNTGFTNLNVGTGGGSFPEAATQYGQFVPRI